MAFLLVLTVDKTASPTRAARPRTLERGDLLLEAGVLRLLVREVALHLARAGGRSTAGSSRAS